MLPQAQLLNRFGVTDFSHVLLNLSVSFLIRLLSSKLLVLVPFGRRTWAKNNYAALLVSIYNDIYAQAANSSYFNASLVT